jgi:two-component system LytT family response regulator
MKSFIDSIPFSKSFTYPRAQVKNERILFWLIITVSLLAVLELGQDYISALLNSGHFSIMQSLAYKLFWFVFIPFASLLLGMQYKYQLNMGRGRGVIQQSLLIILITSLHLLTFSLLLYILSFTISDKPWSLTFLLTQKLSTRLYLSLFIYIIFSFIYHYLNQKKHLKSKDQTSTQSTLHFKNGNKTSLVNPQQINRIVSDGPYLEVYTLENKYVVLNSLKNIILSLPENFRRIHKSTIVNIDHIESTKSRGNGDYDVRLKCGKTVRLSRNYAKPLKGILQ